MVISGKVWKAERRADGSGCRKLNRGQPRAWTGTEQAWGLVAAGRGSGLLAGGAGQEGVLHLFQVQRLPTATPRLGWGQGQGRARQIRKQAEKASA